MFKNKNIPTIILITITVVLAAVGIFTAIKLYSLRDVGVAPNSPESHPGAESTIEIINTNSTFFDQITFVNVSGKDQNMDFHRDSWDNDALDEVIRNVFVKNGESYTVRAFPDVCTKFQIDARFSDDVTTKGENYWQRGWIVEKDNNPNCKTTSTPTPTETATGTPTPTPSDTPTPTPTATPNLCILEFTLGSTSTPTGTPTPTPTATPTGTPTATPTQTPTATPTSTPNTTSTPFVATSTPIETLPAAGSGDYTILMVIGGIALLIISIALAF